MTKSSKRQTSGCPQVVIAGRINVGKSTLFNRLIGRRRALVDSEKGTTRDRISSMITAVPHPFCLIDTGGFVFLKEMPFAKQVNQAIDDAIKAADIIILVCDGREGVHVQDQLIADQLRGIGKPVILAANKLDDTSLFVRGDEFLRLGFKPVIKISAKAGLGIPELLDVIEKKIPKAGIMPVSEYLFTLSIVGEPNVGKSTYFNAALKKNRMIVSDIPGTTRDAVDEIITYRDIRIRFYDTAGIRKRASVKDPVVHFSLQRTTQAVLNSDVVLFFFDATHPLWVLSRKMIHTVIRHGKCCVLVGNKWDLIRGVEQGNYEKTQIRRMVDLDPFPLALISAAKGTNVFKPIDLAIGAYRNRFAVIKTQSLNQFLQTMKTKRIFRYGAKLTYLTQLKTTPPHFLLFAKKSSQLSSQLLRYLEREIRLKYDLWGTPVVIAVREG